jgi:dihydropteroate synthase
VSENPAVHLPASGEHEDRHWDLGVRKLRLTRRPLVMGILNVTPDSFSDGGANFDPDSAVRTAVKMAEDGADIIDIGGESTRPYSDVVAEDEEIRRVMPVIERMAIERMAGRLSIPISIDTSKSSVAAAAVDAGAEIINDVTGLQGDRQMADVACSRQVGICVMHMQGTPQTMQDNPTYQDIIGEIHEYLAARLQFCLGLGIPRQRICLDPGIGFGKTHEHNLQLARAANRFRDLGCPILVGHSRKGFIGHVLGDKQADRTAATLGVSLALAARGVDILRVHDVRPTVDALRLFEACGGFDPV